MIDKKNAFKHNLNAARLSSFFNKRRKKCSFFILDFKGSEETSELCLSKKDRKRKTDCALLGGENITELEWNVSECTAISRHFSSWKVEKNEVKRNLNLNPKEWLGVIWVNWPFKSTAQTGLAGRSEADHCPLLSCTDHPLDFVFRPPRTCL